MVRCQKCGQLNDEDATFCEGCGSNLKTTFSRAVPKEPLKKKDRMRRSTKLLIVFGVILVAGLSIVAGVMVPAIFHPIQNNSFSDSGISFQYPGNWSNNATITWTDSNSLQNETIGKLGNGNVTLGVLYEPISSDDLQTLGKMTVDSWSNNGVSGNVVSNTVGQVGANPVDEIIYNASDPVTNVLYENYYVLLGGSGNHVYAMRFRAPQTDFAKYYPQFQSIVSSVIIANQTVTTDPNTQSTNSNNSGFISSQQAIDVAEPIIGYEPNGVNSNQNVYTAQLIDGTPYGSPYYYQVSARYQNGGGWSYEPTKVDVNAKTGQMITTFSTGSPDPLIPD
jgi:hypothetical protein